MWTFRRFYFKISRPRDKSTKNWSHKGHDEHQEEGHEAGRRSACEAGRRRATVRHSETNRAVFSRGLFPVNEPSRVAANGGPATLCFVRFDFVAFVLFVAATLSALVLREEDRREMSLD